MDNFNEENLIDEIQFKPLTQGLGFHHNDTEDDYAKRLQEVEVLNKPTDIFAKNSTQKMSDGDVVDMGQLQAFYTEEKIETITPVADLLKEEKTDDKKDFEALIEQASWSKRFMAWTLDLALLTSAISIVLLTAVAFLNLSPSFVQGNLLTIAPLFFMMYLFYFSVLERTSYSTLGKRAFNIKVISNPMTLSKSVARSVLTLLGLITFGLSSILDFQSKLTDTKVVKS